MISCSFNSISSVDGDILLLICAVDDLVLPPVSTVPHVDDLDGTPICSSHKLHVVTLDNHRGEVNDVFGGGLQSRTVANQRNY
jgi:hypothetical protein